MNFSPRWKKLLGDVNATRGRMLMMVLAIAVGVFGVGTILNAYAILTREITRNYINTNPASALLELDKVDNTLLNAVRLRPEIAAAEASSTVTARLEFKPNEWMPLLLFVIQDFKKMQINTFTPETGAFPPPTGSMLLEREALRLINSKVGKSLRVQTPNGAKLEVTIAGTVHDPGLAPAGQEQTAYGYITPATLEQLGESSTLHILKVIVKDQPLEISAIEKTVGTVAVWLKSQGRIVDEIRVPPPAKHPHQTQMTAILAMLLMFSFMALVLSAILTATMIGGMLAQQVRQIGVMKAIGARSSQIAGLYLTLIAIMGVIAVLVGVPLGLLAGRGFSSVIGELLNFKIYSDAIPAWIYVLQVGIGILVPLLIALFPILNATRVTVREAINDFGSSRNTSSPRWFDALLETLRFDRTLILAIRNTFRRKGRLILTLGLLAAAGGMFMTSLNVKAAWEQALIEAANSRHYDLEIRFNRPASENTTLKIISSVPGVQAVEAWNNSPAALARADGLDIVRTYPDGGHASFTLRSMPLKTQFVQLTMITGRWLETSDTDLVMLNHTAKAFFPNAKIGDTINLNVEGRAVQYKLIGVAREILTPASAYVIPSTFARATGFVAQTNAVRIVLRNHNPASMTSVGKDIERALEKQHISLKVSISEGRLDGALNGHVYILIFALMSMSVLMAIVGILGLMSTMSTNVVERTREFGIMRTIGGQSLTVLRNVISEGIFIGLMSWVLAIVLSLPLSAFVGNLVGTLSFRLPLPLILSPTTIFLWLGLIVLGAIAASSYPAWKASQLTIRETLAHV